MKIPDTKQRYRGEEIMDDFELQGKELQKTLEDLNRINSWLGGNMITIEALKKLLKNSPSSKKEINIADIGCGDGEMLREIAMMGRKKNLNLKLTGIDANPHAIALARELSQDFPEIDFLTRNIFSPEFQKLHFDAILCTLTLHHFEDEKIIELIQNFYRMTNLGIVVNDLQRSRIAYGLFQAFCWFFVSNEIARKDGLISILRSFKRNNLEFFSSKIPSEKIEIHWKWAFRYQWIIYKK